jgi:DNA-binding NarL/FixJ family response regulator
MIKVVAADDHCIFLEGVKSLFLSSPSISMLETCSEGEQLLTLISKHHPDIALVDISMPGPGIENIVESVSALDVKTKLIALTMHLEAGRASRLFALGLSGYVLKDDAFEQLELAILAVASGDEYISPRMVSEMKGAEDENVSLTARELEVLQYLAEGLINKTIAEEMGVSERTVRFHISNCCLKLRANRRSGVVAKALQMNLIR